MPQAVGLQLPLPLPGAAPAADPATLQAALAVLQQHAQSQQLLNQLLLGQAAPVPGGHVLPPLLQFSLKLQPQAAQQGSHQSQPLVHVPMPSAPSTGQPPRAASGPRPGGSPPRKPPKPAGRSSASDSDNSRQRESAVLLAAADSLGALSAGDGSLRSVSVPSKHPAPAEAARAAAKRDGPDPQGIPTDEELAQLHEELTAGQASAAGGLGAAGRSAAGSVAACRRRCSAEAAPSVLVPPPAPLLPLTPPPCAAPLNPCRTPSGHAARSAGGAAAQPTAAPAVRAACSQPSPAAHPPSVCPPACLLSPSAQSKNSFPVFRAAMILEQRR